MTGFAGTSDPRHHALVLQAIEDRVSQGTPRSEAVTEVLGQEYAWRQEELDAARYSPVGDFLTGVSALLLRLMRRKARRTVGRKTRGWL